MSLHTFQAAILPVVLFMHVFFCTKNMKNILFIKTIYGSNTLFGANIRNYLCSQCKGLVRQRVKTARYYPHCLLRVFFLFCHPSCPPRIPPLPDRLVAYLVWQQ